MDPLASSPSRTSAVNYWSKTSDAWRAPSARDGEDDAVSSSWVQTFGSSVFEKLALTAGQAVICFYELVTGHNWS